MLKRNRTLPPRPCGELRSMSRTWYTPPLYSTTLPRLMSLALTDCSPGRHAAGAVLAEGFAVQAAVAEDVADTVGDPLRVPHPVREAARGVEQLQHHLG